MPVLNQSLPLFTHVWPPRLPNFLQLLRLHGTWHTLASQSTRIILKLHYTFSFIVADMLWWYVYTTLSSLRLLWKNNNYRQQPLKERLEGRQMYSGQLLHQEKVHWNVGTNHVLLFYEKKGQSKKWKKIILTWNKSSRSHILQTHLKPHLLPPLRGCCSRFGRSGGRRFCSCRLDVIDDESKDDWWTWWMSDFSCNFIPQMRAQLKMMKNTACTFSKLAKVFGFFYCSCR